MFALFVGMAFLFVGNGLIISSAGVELKKMGAGELETGFVIAVFFVGAMIATIFRKKLSYNHADKQYEKYRKKSDTFNIR